MFFDQRGNQRQKRRVAAKLHLERQALALVDAHRAGASHGQRQRFARQVLLVAGVAGFVHDAHQAAHEIVFGIAGGDAHVVGHAAAKRVAGDVEPATLKVKAQQAHHVQSQCALLFGGKRPLRWQHRFLDLFGQHLLHQIRQPGFDVAKNAVNVSAAGAGFVQVHQRVVGADPLCLRQDLRLLTR
jgi:hypothetical protein